ncbi:MAG TPA: VOC family protein [Actinomycetales bacterium]|nr:VOC family protein [Actinomycetales bacterium]
MSRAFTGISHLDLSVSDVEASADWHQRVLGLSRVRRADFESRTMIVLVEPASGLIIGLNQHAERPDGTFDERRVGLDHVGLTVQSRDELADWEAHLTELGVEHSAVTDSASGSGTALVFRDPDNIQLELWWTRPRSTESLVTESLVTESLVTEQ